MGHANIATTAIYLSTDEQKARAAADKVSLRVGAPQPAPTRPATPKRPTRREPGRSRARIR